MKVTIEPVENGWIVHNHGLTGNVRVFLKIEDVLNYVYREVYSNWNVSDEVKVERHDS